MTGGSNSSPLQWKWGVLATGPPGEPPTPEHLWALGTWCSVSILRQALGGGYLTPLSYRREAGAQGSGPAGGQRAKTGDWHSERSEAPRPPGPCDSERRAGSSGEGLPWGLSLSWLPPGCAGLGGGQHALRSEAPRFSPKAAPWSRSLPSELDWLKRGRDCWKDFQPYVCLQATMSPRRRAPYLSANRKSPSLRAGTFPAGFTSRNLGFRCSPGGEGSRESAAEAQHRVWSPGTPSTEPTWFCSPRGASSTGHSSR